MNNITWLLERKGTPKEIIDKVKLWLEQDYIPRSRLQEKRYCLDCGKIMADGSTHEVSHTTVKIRIVRED
jgi:hypothetical protein